MRKRTITQAKAELSQLVRAVESGDEVLILRGKTPVAKIMKFSATQTARKPGRLKGKIKIVGDLEFSKRELKDLFDL